jgi:tetratricopeptide (TPR) repeat protein
MPLADLGCLLGQLNRKAEAQRVLEDLGELGRRVNVQPTYLGFVHASLGNHDEAFACFSQGLEQQNASLMWLREYCRFAGLDRLRADPRFEELLKQIGVQG